MPSVRAIRMFPVERDGQAVVVPAGARLSSTDPIVKQNPTMFEPVKRSKARRQQAKR